MAPPGVAERGVAGSIPHVVQRGVQKGGGLMTVSLINESLIEVIYVSRRLPDMPDDQIVDEIALPSMRRNRQSGITGCLWFDQSYFVQVLEGPGSGVEPLLGRIQADPRHTSVRIVRCRPIAERAFDRFTLRVPRHVSDEAVSLLPVHIFETAVGSELVNDAALNSCVVCLARRPQSV